MHKVWNRSVLPYIYIYIYIDRCVWDNIHRKQKGDASKFTEFGGVRSQGEVSS